MSEHKPRGISLVGLPGSGKSTVGKQLARKLAFSFVDSDQVIEDRLGCSIREFFDREGEERFRDLERDVIAELLHGRHELTRNPGWVLSTGGGAVLRPENRKMLSESSHVVYLRASPEDLYRRLRHDKTRPLLQVGDPLGKLRELYQARDPLYQECAEYVVETGRPSVQALANLILVQLELAGLISSQSHDDLGPGR
jgi:shikimate kinase